MGVLRIVFVLLRVLFSSRSALAAENMALRQQLAVLRRSTKRPKLWARDRLFWVLLSCLWTGWRGSLHMVQPATVVKWHRQGFKLFWCWKSRCRKPGRPKVGADIRELIRRISRENALWGSPRIVAELHLLGHDVAKSTVEKYMVRGNRPPSQTWRTFLDNHIRDIAAVDFFTVPTVTFRVLYCFIVLRHDRRRVIHFNVTEHPTEQWAAQQIIEAFPWDEVSQYLLRDRDAIYGSQFRQRVEHMGMEEVTIAFRSPRQSPYLERLIGSIRRECLDHMIILSETHLQRILTSFFEYYHESRTHQSLEDNAPIPRPVDPPDRGEINAIPQVGGLHHRYARAA